MTRFDKYAAIVGEYISAREYPTAPKTLYDPVRYTMADGGKRLRPLFVVGTCGLWRDDVSTALPAAAAIEMFHNFTLMHDDIMDNAPLRRGRESVCKRWGQNVATLAGDALMIMSYGELARGAAETLPEMTRYFNEAAIKVCEGQQFDMDFEERDRVTVAEHIDMIERKTAALFVGAVSMGAVAGGASLREVELLREFARQFGVAFQMQDDLLDSYGDERLGKTVGGDIIEGKKTYLKMMALAAAGAAVAAGVAGAAGAADKAELTLIHKDLRYTPEEKIARVLALYEKYGVRAAAEDEISRRFTAAAAALDALAPSVETERIEEFKAFALSQLGRTK